MRGFASRISGVAFAAFLAASFLGAWQMWVRSPLGANIGTPGEYFISVTAHGVSMAYVLTTFFIMGFGYFVAVTALDRPLPGKAWAWLGFWMGVIGVLLALAAISAVRPPYSTRFILRLWPAPGSISGSCWSWPDSDLARPDARRDAGVED